MSLRTSGAPSKTFTIPSTTSKTSSRISSPPGPQEPPTQEPLYNVLKDIRNPLKDLRMSSPHRALFSYKCTQPRGYYFSYLQSSEWIIPHIHFDVHSRSQTPFSKCFYTVKIYPICQVIFNCLFLIAAGPAADLFFCVLESRENCGCPLPAGGKIL